MSNQDKLRDLVCDTFLISPAQYRPDLRRDEIDTWDSLGVVALAVGVQEVFGYHLTPTEATSVKSLPELIALLTSKGIAF